MRVFLRFVKTYNCSPYVYHLPVDSVGVLGTLGIPHLEGQSLGCLQNVACWLVNYI